MLTGIEPGFPEKENAQSPTSASILMLGNTVALQFPLKAMTAHVAADGCAWRQPHVLRYCTTKQHSHYNNILRNVSTFSQATLSMNNTHKLSLWLRHLAPHGLTWTILRVHHACFRAGPDTVNTLLSTFYTVLGRNTTLLQL